MSASLGDVGRTSRLTVATPTPVVGGLPIVNHMLDRLGLPALIAGASFTRASSGGNAPAIRAGRPSRSSMWLTIGSPPTTGVGVATVNRDVRPTSPRLADMIAERTPRFGYRDAVPWRTEASGGTRGPLRCWL